MEKRSFKIHCTTRKRRKVNLILLKMVWKNPKPLEGRVNRIPRKPQKEENTDTTKTFLRVLGQGAIYIPKTKKNRTRTALFGKAVGLNRNSIGVFKIQQEKEK